MRFVFIVCLFLSLCSFGQTDTLFYDDLTRREVGDYHEIYFKSRMTGMDDTLRLKKGKWFYQDSLGNNLVELHFKVNKRKQRFYKDGLEVFMHPATGDTLLMRNYREGRVMEQIAFKTGILKIENTIYHIYKDFGAFTIAEYRFDYEGTQDFASVWKSSMEDPTAIFRDTAYLRMEREIGDPSLLQPASFSTKAEYNYVSNPEFEKHPSAYFSIMSFENHVSDWSVASISPDLYLSPTGAISGNSYLGIRVFSLRKDIEYVQNRLKAPLEKDSTYCFSAYLKLSPKSRYASNAFGFLLSKEEVYIDTDQLLKIQASKRLDNQILNYKTRWMKVQCTYTAKGGEKFLTLGSFQNHKELKMIEVPGDAPESYYYLEDVSLVPISKEEDCACNFADDRIDTLEMPPSWTETDTEESQSAFDTLKKGDKLILDDIHFENDKAIILAESFATLSSVLDYLLNNRKVRVEISGHTSSLGSARHNYILSEKRANSVLKFLIKNGVDEKRIETAGYGPDYPIASDDTPEGQKENRRVEFKILSL